MTIQTIRIVYLGLGPQIEGHRLTVMDVFYYLHCGHEFDFIHRAMPSLTRAEFDVVVAYVNEHRAELVEKDRRVEERIQMGIAEQKARGLHPAIDESVAVEERAERLKASLRQVAESAEKNGGIPAH